MWLREGNIERSAPGRFCEEGGGHVFDVRDLLRGGSLDVVADQSSAAFANVFVFRRILSARSQQFFEPVFAEACMHGFVGPIEIHIVLAERITVLMKKLGASRFMADFFVSKK